MNTVQHQTSISTSGPHQASGPHQTPDPYQNERPTSYADRIGRWYEALVSTKHKKSLGQYLTSLEVAMFMARLCNSVDRSPNLRDSSPNLLDHSLNQPNRNLNQPDRNPLHPLRVLDPGAGAGILSCAFCETLAEQQIRPEAIDLEVWETDLGLAVHLETCLSYAQRWLQDRRITLRFTVNTDDFVMCCAGALSCAGSLGNSLKLFPGRYTDSFDLVIANPPYFKVAKSDPRAQAAKAVVHGQPNIYAFFMAISASLLRQGGELVFITPRSYTAGPYFRLFRKRFFATVQPEAIHLFGSRRDAFGRDEILQENVILLARRSDGWSARLAGQPAGQSAGQSAGQPAGQSGRQPADQHYNQSAAQHGKQHAGQPASQFADQPARQMVTVSSSAGLSDLSTPTKRYVPLSEVLDMASKDIVLRIPVDGQDDHTGRVVRSWRGNLHACGFEISTGPVVPFRAASLLSRDGQVPETHAPLLWMQNVTAMRLEWPTEARGKEQYIMVSVASGSLLLADKNYVLLRRFSSKEQRRRLTAAPLLAGKIGSPLIGLENHLNYIHRPGGSLTPEEVYGLAVLLNSALLDNFFRTCNGNTQVSATELRAMPLPPLELIVELGRRAMSLPGLTGLTGLTELTEVTRPTELTGEVDSLIEDTLNISTNYRSVKYIA